MTSKFRVRFVAADKHPYAIKDTKSRQPQDLDHPNQRRKSQFGCLECKTRHVKCDETFPVCIRCQRRGAICRSAVRRAQWQFEMPWLGIQGLPSTISSKVNHRLLQYWVEKGSQIMVIDPNINPFSFGILKYLEASQSLVHVVQSLSVAHENFFGSSTLTCSLQERGQALSMVQKELRETNQAPHGSLLAILILALSSVWVNHQTRDDYGQEHLLGARALLDILLAEPGSKEDPFIQLAVATYLLWDQATAFVPHSRDQVPLYSTDLFLCVQTMRSKYNATVGYAIEVLYLLGELGRYCRTIIDGGRRDVEVEASLEEQLLTWTPAGDDYNSYLVNDSFRKHGLIMLYRAIGSVATPLPLDLTDDKFYYHEDLIQEYATDILQNIETIPEDCPYHCILSQPLLTAGAELSQNESDMREKVLEHFRKIYSLSRIPANLYAIEFLYELWTIHDAGCNVFWMSYLMQKARIFVLC